MDKLRIIIIEDDIDTCRKFTEAANNYDAIELIQITSSSTQAINYINKYNPDAIILDLELHNGEGSGLALLNAIHSGQVKRNPFILVTTNNPSESTLRTTQQLGVDFTLKKYQQGYSEALALEHILLFKDQISNKKIYNNDDDNSTTQTYKQKIFEELNTFGISLRLLGHKYLTDAILYVIEDEDANYINMLSIKYKKSEDSIKKAIQHAINRAWSHTDIEILENCYTSIIDVYQGGPTIKSFVNYYAEKVQFKK